MPSEYDFGRMQEEAVRRAKEMRSRARVPQQRRSQPAHELEQSPSEQEAPAPPETSAAPPPAAPQESAPQPEALESDSGGMLGSLFRDKERTIILALLILLSNDGDHHELMFALMFLLM